MKKNIEAPMAQPQSLVAKLTTLLESNHALKHELEAALHKAELPQLKALGDF